MINEIIEVIGIAWMIIHIKSIIETLSNSYLSILQEIISCFMCTSFWVALIYTGNFGVSGFISLVCYCIDRYLINTDIKL